MVQQASTPSTDELLREASSTNGRRHRIHSPSGVIALFVQSDRILAYRGEEPSPFGLLRFGGPYSGAIWIGDELIGEYGKTFDGSFFVVEIEDGFLTPDSRREEDPLAFLIAHATA